jgi:hypothetical protein
MILRNSFNLTIATPKTTLHRFMISVLIAIALPLPAKAGDQTLQTAKPKFRGAILAAKDITADRLKKLAADGFNSVSILVEGTTEKQSATERRAAELILTTPFELSYWIEVARCPALADAHPAWMASLQTHDEWRRFFPDTPQPTAHEVVKTYPWVPILSREPFAAQLDRVKKLLAILPTPHGLFLNDLQGAPSACGCGNPLCRWTSDYGKRRTTTPLGDDAATLFVNAVKKAVPNSKVIPVWTTECEKHDGSSDGLCAGVGCFDGICWKAYTRQLAALEQTCNELGVLVPYRAFQRDIPIYGEEAGWILHAVKSFSTMPPKHGGKPIKPSRLITILQGWDVDDQQVTRQIEVSAASGTSGFFVAYVKLDQSWRPKVVSWR